MYMIGPHCAVAQDYSFHSIGVLFCTRKTGGRKCMETSTTCLRGSKWVESNQHIAEPASIRTLRVWNYSCMLKNAIPLKAVLL
jgi:hypothetical protein